MPLLEVKDLHVRFDTPEGEVHAVRGIDFTLEPGDLIFTGTPAGVGVAHDPPAFMKVGDTVRIEIDRIGHIEHQIVAETGETRIG